MQYGYLIINSFHSISLFIRKQYKMPVHIKNEFIYLQHRYIE